MQERYRSLSLFLAFVLLFSLAQTVLGAEPSEDDYRFLAELAALHGDSGFPPALFKPESEPSRMEIAFFLYRFDQHLARQARAEQLDLRDALRRTWSAAKPEIDSAKADAWAASATTAYRRLLIEYHRELGALGYRLRPDAYPMWSRGISDALGY